MRRFRARPFGLLLVATGVYWEKPLATSRDPLMFDFSWRKRTTLVARAVDSSQLVGNCA